PHPGCCPPRRPCSPPGKPPPPLRSRPPARQTAVPVCQETPADILHHTHTCFFLLPSFFSILCPVCSHCPFLLYPYRGSALSAAPQEIHQLPGMVDEHAGPRLLKDLPAPEPPCGGKPG